MKSFVVVNGNAAANRIVFQALQGSTALGYWILHLAASNAAGEYDVLEPWTVLLAGQKIKLLATSAGNPVHVMISGAELTL